MQALRTHSSVAWDRVFSLQRLLAWEEEGCGRHHRCDLCQGQREEKWRSGGEHREGRGQLRVSVFVLRGGLP